MYASKVPRDLAEGWVNGLIHEDTPAGVFVSQAEGRCHEMQLDAATVVLEKCRDGAVVKAKPAKCGGVPTTFDELLSLIRSGGGLSREDAEASCRKCLEKAQGADSPAGAHDCGECWTWSWIHGWICGSALPKYVKVGCSKVLSFPKNPCRATRIPRAAIEALAELAGVTTDLILGEAVVQTAAEIALRPVYGTYSATVAQAFLDYVLDNVWLASGSVSGRADVKVECVC